MAENIPVENTGAGDIQEPVAVKQINDSTVEIDFDEVSSIEKQSESEVTAEDLVKPKEPEQQSEAEKLLAGKYKSEEELQKGLLELLKKQTGAESLEDIYKTLESGLGKQQPSDQPEQQPESSSEPDLSLLDEYLAEYMEKGDLSDEAYEALKKNLGDVPKPLIKEALEARKVRVEQYSNQLYELAGGKEQYESLINWASKNLPREEQDAFDAAVMSMQPTLVKWAIDSIRARMETTSTEDLVTASSASLGTYDSDVYTTLEEVFKDLGSEEFVNNPKFAARVRAKLARSNLDLEDLF